MNNKIKSLFAGSLRMAAIVMLYAVTCPAIPLTAKWDSPPTTLAERALAEAQAANYIVQVQWKDAKGNTNVVRAVTTEGDFMDTFQLYPAKSDIPGVPVLVTLNGRLDVTSPEKGRLSLDLVQKAPRMVSTNEPSSSPSYQYVTSGLNSTFVVTFDKPLLIHTDENGETFLVVKHADAAGMDTE